MPGDKMPEVDLEFSDKVVHVIMYLGLTGLIVGYGRLKTKYSSLKVVLFAVIFASMLGWLIEILQEHVFSNRSFDVYDIMSNIIGSLLGAIIMNFIINSKK